MLKPDKQLIILSNTDSTNNYAMQLIASNRASHGTVVLTHWQQQGKGQRGNSWESDPGRNLLLSIIVFPDFLMAEKQFYLSKITTLAIVDLVRDEVEDVTVKWPNDIYAGDKKLSGILIENIIQDNFIYASVVGIGLNVNQISFSREVPNPVSLKLITGRDYSVSNLTESLTEKFFQWYNKLESGGISDIDSAYLSNLYRKNTWAKFIRDGKVFEARITGIGEYGQLKTEDRRGSCSEHLFKEIEYVI